jgi:DNA-binding MarR family transcriptional regulator
MFKSLYRTELERSSIRSRRLGLVAPAKRPARPAPDDGEWLDDEQLRHWISLVALLEVLPAALDAQLRRDADMNLFEYSILAGLSDASDHTMGMSELAVFASGSLSRLSHAIRRLEGRGWVQRTPTGVGRNVTVTMTDLGAATMRRCAPSHVAEARRLVVDVLSPAQLAALGRASRRILDAIGAGHTAIIDDVLARRAAAD